MLFLKLVNDDRNSETNQLRYVLVSVKYGEPWMLLLSLIHSISQCNFRKNIYWNMKSVF